MASRSEIAMGSASALCFFGAADAWFGTGAASWIADLCLTDPDAAVPMAPDIMMTQHQGHTNAFLAGGFAFMAAAFSCEFVEKLVRKPAQPLTPQQRRRLLATMIHVALAAGPARRTDIETSFTHVTGLDLLPNEARGAFAALRARRGPDLTEILSEAKTSAEKRDLLRAAVAIWSRVGMDCERCTGVLETIVAALGFSANTVCRLIDAPPVPRRHQPRKMGPPSAAGAIIPSTPLTASPRTTTRFWSTLMSNRPRSWRAMRTS